MALDVKAHLDGAADHVGRLQRVARRLSTAIEATAEQIAAGTAEPGALGELRRMGRQLAAQLELVQEAIDAAVREGRRQGQT